MKPENWITIASIIIGLIIYVQTQVANRRHEIFKERLMQRMRLFDILIPTVAKFIDLLNNQNNYSTDEKTAIYKQLGDLRVSLKCYGETEEIIVYEKLVNAIDNRALPILPDALNTFSALSLKNLRKELGFKECHTLNIPDF